MSRGLELRGEPNAPVLFIPRDLGQAVSGRTHCAAAFEQSTFTVVDGLWKTPVTCTAAQNAAAPATGVATSPRGAHEGLQETAQLPASEEGRKDLRDEGTGVTRPPVIEAVLQTREILRCIKIQLCVVGKKYLKPKDTEKWRGKERKKNDAVDKRLTWRTHRPRLQEKRKT